MFKVYYLDPLIVNTRLLFNCYEDKDLYDYNLFYNSTFASIQQCLENGEDCEFVCKEFRFGTTSDMFIGRLSNYYQFLKEIEEVIRKYDPKLKVDENDKNSELFIEEQNYPEEFFIDKEQDLKLDNNLIINNYNMT